MLNNAATYDIELESPPTSERELCQLFPLRPLRLLAMQPDLSAAEVMAIGEFLDCAIFVSDQSPALTRLCSALSHRLPDALRRLNMRAQDFTILCAALVEAESSPD